MEEFEYNLDEEMRNRIIWEEAEDIPDGDYKEFTPMQEVNYYKLKKLIDLKFANPDERHNAAPSNKEILKFLKKYPDFVATGYAISVDRADYRVCVTGVYKPEATVGRTELMDFIKLFGDADDITISASQDETSCWFD